jgi:hypothetical protein
MNATLTHQHNEEHEKAGQRLNHTDLQVGKRNQFRRHQLQPDIRTATTATTTTTTVKHRSPTNLVGLRVTRRTLHDITFGVYYRMKSVDMSNDTRTQHHNTQLLLTLVGKRNGWNHVSAQIDTQNQKLYPNVALIVFTCDVCNDKPL